MKVTKTTDGKLILPRNKYGNIEIFRENMIPDDCVWLKLTNIENILKNKAQFVPVVTGFAFKAGQAIPVKQGVIVLKQDEIPIKKIWLAGRIKRTQGTTCTKTSKTFIYLEVYL